MLPIVSTSEQQEVAMQPKMVKFLAKFVEGAATSIGAYLAAWTAIVSITALSQFLGHVVGDLVIHWMSAH